jgi:CRISPR-associated protein Cst1
MSVPGLRWTGHALIDVGVAGVCAFTKRLRPEDVTLEDLDKVSEFLIDTYYQDKLGTYLTCVFMNSSFVQPNEKAPKRQAFVERYLRAHRAPADPRVVGRKCVFSGLPATSPLVRTHLPMFSAEGVMNFRPEGTTFVPAAGPYIVALLFLPMASRRAEGKLLCVQAESSALTLRFAMQNLEDNQRLIALSLPNKRALTHVGYDRELPSWDLTKKRYKYADAKGPRSLIIADLIAFSAEATDSAGQVSSLSAYLLSNSGQGPSLDIFDVPGCVVAFVLNAAGPSTRRAWMAVSERFRSVKEFDDHAAQQAERQVPTKEKVAENVAIAAPPGRPGWTKNPAFEDLCAINEAGFIDRNRAQRWLSRYVLGRVNPDARGSRFESTNARIWALAELLLREVVAMKQGQIESIRAFADKLAVWIQKNHDKSLYRSLAMDRPGDLRRSLMRAQRASTEGTQLLFGLDEYATVWLRDDGNEWLIRDLICIRVVEVLAAGGFFDVHPGLMLEKLGTSEETIQ